MLNARLQAVEQRFPLHVTGSPSVGASAAKLGSSLLRCSFTPRRPKRFTRGRISAEVQLRGHRRASYLITGTQENVQGAAGAAPTEQLQDGLLTTVDHSDMFKYDPVLMCASEKLHLRSWKFFAFEPNLDEELTQGNFLVSNYNLKHSQITNCR